MIRNEYRTSILTLMAATFVVVSAYASKPACWVLSGVDCVKVGNDCQFNFNNGTITGDPSDRNVCSQGTPGNATCDTGDETTSCTYDCTYTLNGQQHTASVTINVSQDSLSGGSC